jgi:UPF0755 protein
MVRNAKLFFLQMKLSVYNGKAVPGVYTVNSSMTPQELMAAISPENEETEETESTATVISTEEPAADEDDGVDVDDEYAADDDFVEE